MSKRFQWPCIGLTLALVAAVLAPTAWPLITSDAPNTHVLPSTGGTAAENSYGPDEVNQAHGDSGCPSFVIPDEAIYEGQEPPVFIQDPSQVGPEWTISGTTSYTITPDPSNPYLSTPVNWAPHTGVDYNPQNTSIGTRSWGGSVWTCG